MKRFYYSVLPMMMLLSACSHTAPKSCLTADSYPRPQSLCNSVDPIKVGTVPNPAVKTQPASNKRSLATVLLTLIETNPDIGIAGAKEKEQEVGIDIAKAAKRPTLDVSVSSGPQQIFWPDPAGFAIRKEASANVHQVLYDFGAIKNDVKRAELTYESAASERIAKTEEVAFDMLNAYLKVRQTDDLIAVTQENIAAHDKIRQLVELREQNGNATVADVKRIATRLESAKSSLIDLTTQRSDAAAAFLNLTSVNSDNIDAGVLATLKGQPETINPEVLEKHPAMIALQQEIAALKYQLASTKAEKLPVFGLQGSAKISQNVSSAEDGDNQLSASGLVTMRVSLLDGGLNNDKQSQILSRLEGARMKLEKERRSLWEDAQNAQRISSSDGEKSGSIEAQVAAAKKVADLNLEQFKDGAKSVFELLDGQADYFKAKGQLVEQTYNRRRAEIRALQLRAQLVRAVLGLPPGKGALPADVQTDDGQNEFATGLPGVRTKY